MLKINLTKDEAQIINSVIVASKMDFDAKLAINNGLDHDNWLKIFYELKPEMKFAYPDMNGKIIHLNPQSLITKLSNILDLPFNE